MHVERDFDGPRAGARWGARLEADRWGRTFVQLGSIEALIEGEPSGLSLGRLVDVELVREAIPEPGRMRPGKARVLGTGARLGELQPGPGLASRLAGVSPGFPEPVGEAWAEAWEAAETGMLAIPGGRLLMVPTPALLAIDIDGTPAPAEAARSIARAIRLFGLSGNIAIDFPTRAGKSWRQDAAAAFDAEMGALAFERTAINGFGLLQVVRPRPRASILDRAMLARDEGAALALLGQALREPRPGGLQLVARPAIIGRLKSVPALVAALEAKAGRRVDLVVDPSAGEGHVRIRDNAAAED